MGDTQNTVDLTVATFDEVTKASGIVLVDFWAEWCTPCKAFAPVFEAAAAENPDLTFAKVDVDANQPLGIRLNIMSIPTLTIYRDGEVVYSRPGAISKAALDEAIADARG